GSRVALRRALLSLALGAGLLRGAAVGGRLCRLRLLWRRALLLRRGALLGRRRLRLAVSAAGSQHAGRVGLLDGGGSRLHVHSGRAQRLEEVLARDPLLLRYLIDTLLRHGPASAALAVLVRRRG